MSTVVAEHKIEREANPSPMLNTSVIADQLPLPDDTNIVSRINQQYLGRLPGFNVQIIQSPIGTGKTEAVCEFIDRHRDETVCVISPRRTNTSHLVARLNNAFNKAPKRSRLSIVRAPIIFHDYQDGIQEGKKYPYLVIQPESLHLVRQKYGILILDEITTNLNQMNSGLHGKNLERNRQVFSMLTTEAKYVLQLDGYIDQRASDFIEHHRKKDTIHGIVNTYRRYEGYQCWSVQEDRFRLSIEQALAAGKNLHIVLTTKAYGEKYIEPLLRRAGVSYLFYKGKEKVDTRILANVNIEWANYRVVMHTSKIGPGIDFSPVTPHFHLRFVQAKSTTLPIPDVMQMRGRVRELIDRTEYVYFDTRKDTYPTDYKTIESDIMASTNSIILSASTVVDKAYLFDAAGNCKFYEPWSIWKHLEILDIMYRNKSRNDYKKMYIDSIGDTGFTFGHGDELTDEVKEELREEKADLKEIFDATTEAELFNAPVATSTQLAELDTKAKRGDLTKQEVIISEKSHFLNIIKPEIGPALTGAQLKVGIKNRSLLYRMREMVDFTEEEMVHTDILRYKGEANRKDGIARRKAVNWLRQTLGFTSLHDRTTEVREVDIRQHLTTYTGAYEFIKASCKLNIKQPVDYRNTKIMINAALATMGYKLEALRTTGSAKMAIYGLREKTEHLDVLVEAMKPLKFKAKLSKGTIGTGNLFADLETLIQPEPPPVLMERSIDDTISIFNNVKHAVLSS